ncbi:hypothetical protein [Tenacibaculum sp. M341]|uniref:hypothetical protein n=1 Tax=Tenacibaculum sp. M341 TaxID=2530339 RepID=UPI001048AAC1|nr:hypothetical protein [Tenacibaculum sp. M341]TCI90158.1 hypothetical protein EYW44_14590 [Tenacibaculum sp. M341]
MEKNFPDLAMFNHNQLLQFYIKKLFLGLMLLFGATISFYGQENHFEWDKSLGRFQNGLEDQVAYINFGDAKLWGYIEVTITGGYGYRLTTGKYTKRFQVAKNPGSGYFSQSSEVPASFGHIGAEWKIGELEFVDGNLRIPVYHLLSTGNTPHVHIEGVTVASYDTNNITITAPVTIPNDEVRDYVKVSNRINFENAINFKPLQSTWITGKNDYRGINATQQKQGHYQSLIRQKTASGHVVNIGGIGDLFGFWGFDKNRTANATDYQMIMDLKNGNVGIGTFTPGAKLHINNGNNSYGAILANADESKFSLYTKTLSTQPANIEAFRLGLKYDTNENNGFISFYRGSSSGDGYLGFSTSGKERIRIDKLGNVDIGTQTTGVKLEVKGSMKLNTGTSDLLLYRDNDVGNWSLLRSNTGEGIAIIGQPDRVALSVSRSIGNVGIGTKVVPAGFKLGVNGKMAATEVKVATYENWADFVFEEDYALPTLKEVEKHIEEKGHLENIPSAEEVKKDGFFLGEMDAKLLRKIEELTLYTIQQEKDLESQESRIKNQEEKIQIQKEELEKTNSNNSKLLSIIEKLEKRIEKLESK